MKKLDLSKGITLALSRPPYSDAVRHHRHVALSRFQRFLDRYDVQHWDEVTGIHVIAHVASLILESGHTVQSAQFAAQVILGSMRELINQGWLERRAKITPSLKNCISQELAKIRHLDRGTT